MASGSSLSTARIASRISITATCLLSELAISRWVKWSGFLRKVNRRLGSKCASDPGARLPRPDTVYSLLGMSARSGDIRS